MFPLIRKPGMQEVKIHEFSQVPGSLNKKPKSHELGIKILNFS
jgi:hypothetical protein